MPEFPPPRSSFFSEPCLHLTQKRDLRRKKTFLTVGGSTDERKWKKLQTRDESRRGETSLAFCLPVAISLSFLSFSTFPMLSFVTPLAPLCYGYRTTRPVLATSALRH